MTTETTTRTVPLTSSSNDNELARVSPRHARAAGEAYPQGNAPRRWLEPAIYNPAGHVLKAEHEGGEMDIEGLKCYRVYQFGADEEQAAGDNASALPWDDDHVVSIQLA